MFKIKQMTLLAVIFLFLKLELSGFSVIILELIFVIIYLIHWKVF